MCMCCQFSLSVALTWSGYTCATVRVMALSKFIALLVLCQLYIDVVSTDFSRKDAHCMYDKKHIPVYA